MTSVPIDPRSLRVSDTEREHVVGVLQKAIGRGLIDLDEFTARTDIALAAKTRADLNAVLIDLPGVVHREAVVNHAVPPLEINNTMSSVHRTGSWSVPRTVSVRNNMGSVDLDFTEAVFEHNEVHIELNVTAGSVELLVPEGSGVDLSGVTCTMGSVKEKGGGPHEFGKPKFVLSGQVHAGSLLVRRPSYLRFGSLVVRRPWKIGRGH